MNRFTTESTEHTEGMRGLLAASHDLNDLSGRVIGCAIEVHRELGPGLLESTYERCLCHELAAEKIRHVAQVALPVCYKGLQLDCGYRVDIMVEDALILELKSVESLLPVHDAQVLTYMRIANIHLGLLLNFNVPRLVNGIRRFVL